MAGTGQNTSRRAPENTKTAATTTEQADGQGIVLPRAISVKELADRLDVSPIEIIKRLMRNGVMATINQVVDYGAAAKVATELGFSVREEQAQARVKTTPPHLRFREDKEAQLQVRPPVVTLMGHVDHGKTSLLDAIRESEVAAGEAGGITQHIGAYQVDVRGQKITFLDTPGHEAFTAMRARGAQATDIAVLVVAADDGVMPQTIEAIDHARAAGVPIVVAINKIDKPDANVERVKQELADSGLVIEEWGGDIIAVPVSAKRRQGIGDLLENILVVAEVEELKANPHRRPQGVVIEAEMDKTRGPLATLLVQTGTLKVGDPVVVGTIWGKVKAMFNDKGKHIKRADPSTPAMVLGLDSVPRAGDTFLVAPDDRAARQLVSERQAKAEARARSLRLDDVYQRISSGEVKELNIILKTDVEGSIEPVRTSLEKLGTEQVRVRIIHAATGGITESDVMLAIASGAIIVGFNSRPEAGAKRLADAEGVDIRFYDVIYHLVEDVENALKGLREPTYTEVVEGRAEIIAIFPMGKTRKIAGTRVTEGKLVRGSMARILRGGEVVTQARIESLKHFKEAVKEMSAGFECGILFESFDDFETGDIIEGFRREKMES